MNPSLINWNNFNTVKKWDDDCNLTMKEEETLSSAEITEINSSMEKIIELTKVISAHMVTAKKRAQK